MHWLSEMISLQRRTRGGFRLTLDLAHDVDLHPNIKTKQKRLGNVLNEPKPLGVIFVDSECVRSDLLRVYQTLAEAFSERNMEIKTICGPGVEKSDIENYSFPNTVFWTEAKTKLGSRPLRSSFACKSWKKQFSSSVNQNAPLRTSIYLAMEAQRFSLYLNQLSPAFILGIKFNSFTPAVFAAECLGIPLYAIQHGEYRESSLELHPHEWPAKNIFTFSEKSKREHEKRFESIGCRFISAGPIWDMRQRGNKPETRPGLLLAIESEEEVFSDSLVERLKTLAGVEHFAIKPHPYLGRLGASDALNRHSDFCDFSDFWESLPEVALSLGSSATFELIHLGVPVITVYPESFDSDYFPISGTFRNTSDGISQALTVLRTVLNHKEEQDSLLKNQRRELSDMLTEAPESLKRIVSVVVAETMLS